MTFSGGSKHTLTPTYFQGSGPQPPGSTPLKAAKICSRPCDLDLWRFDLESVVWVT